MSEISVLEEVRVGVCVMRYIDLRNVAIKVLDVSLSFNQKIKYEKNI